MLVSTTAYLDAIHAANKVICSGNNGFIIFLNRAPIIWYRTIQDTVEARTFSSESISDKTCMEHITALSFKICMFGIPVVDSTKTLCDNAYVDKNSSILSSTLNKKHISIANHFLRWHVEEGAIKVAWIDTNTHLSDAMKKLLTAEKRRTLFGQWTY